MDPMVEEKWGNELLGVAARANCEPIIGHLWMLANHNQALEAELSRGYGPIEEAT
jgi:hypothetical protein